MKIEIKCDGINCDTSMEFEAPEGWVSRIGDEEYGGESSYLFCPACQLQRKFFDAQCPGCVTSFPECGLGRCLYPDQNTFTEEVDKVVRTGVCPFRTNGTMFFDSNSGKGPHTMDLSELAPTPTGDAVVDAMITCIKRWPIKYVYRQSLHPGVK